jgi:ribosomal protein L37AE/L43A
VSVRIVRLSTDPAHAVDHPDVALRPAIVKALRAETMPPPPPSRVDRRKAHAAVAYVNHGRWVARCPFCPSAQLVDPDDPRWFCARCENAFVDGAYTTVRFPGDVADVEAALCVRPNERNRNWLPGETAADLRAESDAHLADDGDVEPPPTVVVRRGARPAGTDPGV